ncbi:hypothetical protein EMCRGX_G034452 [Ephydatia muelleri]
MELPSQKRKQNIHLADTSGIPLYKLPPTDTISLEQFETLAQQRLKLLQKVETIRQSGIQDVEEKDETRKTLMAKQIRAAAKELKLIAEDQNDNISHYILRLAFCRTEDLRRWFLLQEVELLRSRFINAPQRELENFFAVNKDDFRFDKFSLTADNQGTQIGEELRQMYDPAAKQRNIDLFKVPFTEMLDLVRSRRVVVKQGYAYVPCKETEMISSLVCNKFRARLSEELLKTSHHFAVVDDDERIAPLVKSLQHRYLGGDFSNTGTNSVGAVSLAQLETLSVESFPPCMRHLHESLCKDHHLRHFGRLQYGLFLKSIGLPLEEALAFWRREFTKKVDLEKFEKQYAYNIRHSYGKEGKRADYTPYSCMKILTSNSPGPGDHHGCPFRHWDEEHVRQMLTSHGLPHKAIQQVMDSSSKSHYQLACQKYFNIKHNRPMTDGFGLEHPTQYFLESRRLRGGATVKSEQGSSVGAGRQQRDCHEDTIQATADETMDMSAQDLDDFIGEEDAMQ